jgi:hypothetical protein
VGVGAADAGDATKRPATTPATTADTITLLADTENVLRSGGRPKACVHLSSARLRLTLRPDPPLNAAAGSVQPTGDTAPGASRWRTG